MSLVPPLHTQAARPKRKPPPSALEVKPTSALAKQAEATIKGPSTDIIFEGKPITFQADCSLQTLTPPASQPSPMHLDIVEYSPSPSPDGQPQKQILPCHQRFIAIIEDLLRNQDANRACDKPMFKFEFTQEAAVHNFKVLESFNFNLSAAILAQRNSPVFFGSELQPVARLQMLFHQHPLWHLMESYLQEGITFPLHPLKTELRRSDCQFMLERVNHKSAKTAEGAKIVKAHMQADVEHGFSLPLPISSIEKFQDTGSIAPLGVQDQSSLTDEGIRFEKWRMTHDQTFPGPSGVSVNKRVITDDLPACMYGHTLLRVLHFIVHLRYRHPTKRILLGKFDLKAAFRRAHLSPATALESMATLEDLLFISLRLTFSGAPCPLTWSCISESICDLANDLIKCPAWDHSMLHSPIQASILPALRLPDTIPLGQAVKLAIKFPRDEIGKTDIFLDDYAPIALDIGDNVDRVACAVPLAIHTVGRQLSDNEPLPRDDLISISKLAAEGRMEETKMLLGWQIDTRRLFLHLPLNKYLGWSNDILEAIKKVTVKGSELDS